MAMEPNAICAIRSEEWRNDKNWGRHYHENSFYRGRVVEINAQQAVYTVDGDFTERKYHMPANDFYDTQNDYIQRKAAGQVRLMVCVGVKYVKTVANEEIQLFPAQPDGSEGDDSEGDDAPADSSDDAPADSSEGDGSDDGSDGGDATPPPVVSAEEAAAETARKATAETARKRAVYEARKAKKAEKKAKATVKAAREKAARQAKAAAARQAEAEAEGEAARS